MMLVGVFTYLVIGSAALPGLSGCARPTTPHLLVHLPNPHENSPLPSNHIYSQIPAEHSRSVTPLCLFPSSSRS
ncbi:hypothetical protein F5882DRAFT_415906, partial [Hyaloscypha sp. PMI_1271]